MEKMHSEALTALRNEHAIEIEKMEEDKNNITIQHVKVQEELNARMRKICINCKKD